MFVYFSYIYVMAKENTNLLAQLAAAGKYMRSMPRELSSLNLLYSSVSRSSSSRRQIFNAAQLECDRVLIKVLLINTANKSKSWGDFCCLLSSPQLIKLDLFRIFTLILSVSLFALFFISVNHVKFYIILCSAAHMCMHVALLLCCSAAQLLSCCGL